MVQEPDLREEMALYAEGYRHIAGLDEAGRGSWAGPVVAGAVILPIDQPDLSQRLEGVRDSKQLTPRQRERLYGTIRSAALAVGVERTFLLGSPRLEKVEVLRHVHVRRAQLYYLRGRKGKAARLKEKR